MEDLRKVEELMAEKAKVECAAFDAER